MKKFVFNKHPEIKDGEHAIFAPSKKYLSRGLTEEQIYNILYSMYAAQIGILIHELCSQLIEEKQPIRKDAMRSMIYHTLYQAKIPIALIQPERYIDTVVPYVKDAIGYDLIPEQRIVYQYPIAWGTADAIKFNPTKCELRIHDLKTGKTPASLDQLIEYAAYFYLEYHIKPGDCKTILSIYQNGEVITGYPTASDILPIMDNAVALTKYVQNTYGG